MAVNVNRNVDDPFYRYKMPRLIAKVEGKGNGIKTVIVNMPEIAKALERPPTYPTKYFGCELGAQTQVDLKNERYIVNGEHDADKLQNLLDGFIRKFVLCHNCDNPETKLSVKKNEIFQNCSACGYGETLRGKDRLITYVIKNPPGQDAVDGTEKASKKDRRSKKSKESVSSPTGDSPGTDSVDGAVMLGMGTGPPDDSAFGDENGSNSDDVEDDDWAVNPEDAAARQQELAVGMACLTVNEDLEKGIDERLDMFYNFITKMKKASSNGTFDSKAVIAEAERLDVKDKAVLLFCRVLLDQNVIANVKTYRSVFLKCTYENKRAQKYLLGGLEQLITDNREALMSKVAHILKTFYDADILEEEAILEWGDKASKRYVSKEDNKLIREKAAPFLKWLREADEESGGSDDDDGDDVEVVYDEEEDYEAPKDGKKRGAVIEPQSALMNGYGKGNHSVVAEEPDGLDIDDI